MPASSRRSSGTSRAINDGIAGIPRERVRLHVCYGNWEGPHVFDVPLVKILPALYQAQVGALSIEFSNPRHAHEYAAFKTHPLPKDMLLIPGVVETTSNFVEHPEVVARRIEEAVAAVGERERVIAGTDCGFGTFTNREWVIEPAVWLKLARDPRRAPISPRPGCGDARARRLDPLLASMQVSNTCDAACVIAPIPLRPGGGRRLFSFAPSRGAEREITQGLANPLSGRRGRPTRFSAGVSPPLAITEARLSALHWRRFSVPAPGRAFHGPRFIRCGGSTARRLHHQPTPLLVPHLRSGPVQSSS